MRDAIILERGVAADRDGDMAVELVGLAQTLHPETH